MIKKYRIAYFQRDLSNSYRSKTHKFLIKNDLPLILRLLFHKIMLLTLTLTKANFNTK